jgi:poly(3-hydroxybutyrate) depolymerase
MSRLAHGCASIGVALMLGGCGQFFDWLGGKDDDAVYDGSRCEEDGDRIHCSYHSDTLWTGLTGITPRMVHWQVPVGEAPAAGWPVAILFQGTLYSADTFWEAEQGDEFGGYNQVLVTRALLDAGFAVVTPEARLAGSGAWETNIPPMADHWQDSGDHAFMLDIFAAIESGNFGALDDTRMFAAGISSGGYMTSRMDLAYRSRFRALAIQSASWATCAGTLCQVPTPLDSQHLPTLFLHGGEDTIVPIDTMLDYHQGLLDAGVETETVIDDDAGHEWLDAAPEQVLEWFERHL